MINLQASIPTNISLSIWLLPPTRRKHSGHLSVSIYHLCFVPSHTFKLKLTNSCIIALSHLFLYLVTLTFLILHITSSCYHFSYCSLTTSFHPFLLPLHITRFLYYLTLLISFITTSLISYITPSPLPFLSLPLVIVCITT